MDHNSIYYISIGHVQIQYKLLWKIDIMYMLFLVAQARPTFWGELQRNLQYQILMLL